MSDQRDQIRESPIQKARLARRRRGLGVGRRRAASYWRTARSSRASSARVRRAERSVTRRFRRRPNMAR